MHGDGQRFWQSPFNTIDLALTLFCALTLLVLALSGCGSTTSKQEELLDTLLLVARNVLQFGRLAAVMRKYVLLVIAGVGGACTTLQPLASL